MADFSGLDPDTRCFAHVGHFLRVWSEMEKSLHIALGAALQIEEKKISILAANMGFQIKTHTLGALIDIAPGLDEGQKTENIKLLSSLGQFAGQTRNIVAHNPFKPDESMKGVQFFRVKARGKFAESITIWMPEDFAKHEHEVLCYQHTFDGLAQMFAQKPIPPEAFKTVPFIQTDWPMPQRRTMSAALIAMQSQPVNVVYPGDSVQREPEQ